MLVIEPHQSSLCRNTVQYLSSAISFPTIASIVSFFALEYLAKFFNIALRQSQGLLKSCFHVCLKTIVHIRVILIFVI